MSVRLIKGDVITAYGLGMESLWSGLCSGRTSIRSLARFTKPGLISNQAANIEDLSIQNGESRSSAILRQLLEPLAGKFHPQTPLILATTIGEVDYIEQAVLEDREHLIEQGRPDQLLAFVKQWLGLRGYAAVVSSACASSSLALTQAATMLKRGGAKQVLVVACDALTEFLYAGFSGLLSLSEQPARPFDTNREGLTLGEGAAWALLGRDPLTGQTSDLSVEIGGWGNTSDAVHMTAPDSQGCGLVRAINKSCRMAKINPRQVNLVIAHGTATPLSDAMEIIALDQTLPSSTPTISIKGAIGHTCGATGLIQILIACRALHEGRLPSTIGLVTPEPGGQDRFIKQAISVPHDGFALSTNSGFGGVNTAVILKEVT